MINISSYVKKGNVRLDNQDWVDFAFNKVGHAFAVLCDGMGGHYGGKVAAKKSCNFAIKSFLEFKNFYPTELEINNFLIFLIKDIIRYLKQLSSENQNLLDMGTTIVIAYFFKNNIYVANVGDSRCYYVSKSSIKQITIDQNLYNKIKRDENSLQENNKANKSILYSAVGPLKNFKIDTYLISPTSGWILLCSDGIYSVIDEKTIIATIIRPLPLSYKCELLLENAIKFRSNDNVSAVLIEFDFLKK
ncbi:serine/threonine-protein phosphatase [symbiont of Argiope bruennichi]|uniref:protein phosphatase 2C domain-containing protein n=1 Tax=symbiont of Argiope bruennichi TaxID=2810479 RepID=UPI003DA44C9B